MNYIFIDTNIFLHFRPVENIQWANYIQGEFRLAVAPVIINELDKKKIDSRSKIRERAKKALSKIEEAALNEDLSLFSFPTQDAYPNDYLDFGLNSLVSDDRLIISILKFMDNDDSPNCYLVTYDTGVRLKAKRFNIPVLVLGDEELLSQEDDQEKEIRQLKAEVQKLQNLQPKLKFQSQDGRALITFDTSLNAEPAPLSPSLKKIDLIETDPFKNPMMLNREMIKQRYGAYNIENYNKAIVLYNAEIDKYYEHWQATSDWFDRSFLFKAVLVNDGNQPADGIEIILKFPNSVTITLPENTPSYPQIPIRPKPDDFNTIDIISGRTQHQRYEEKLVIEETSLLKNNVDISVDEDDAVVYKLSSLKHTRQKEIAPIWFTFPSRNAISNFQITHEIHADNLPVPIKGNFNFVFVT